MIEHPWPHFIIGGAPRSGTTYLATLLDQHPQVCMAKPFIPEPKIFMQWDLSRQEYEKRYFPFFAHSQENQLRGEKTSYYLESTPSRDLLATQLPHTRLIFIVREPVARAYSNWLWSRQNGLETLDFMEAISREGSRPNPLPPEKAYARPFDYLSRGNYGTLAQGYYQRFPREQILFLVYERLQDEAAKVTYDLLEFLGLPAVAGLGADLGIINKAKDDGQNLCLETKEILKRRMLPEVRTFAECTGLDLSLWQYPEINGF